jgi:hypothetical protein
VIAKKSIVRTAKLILQAALPAASLLIVGVSLSSCSGGGQYQEDATRFIAESVLTNPANQTL